MSGLVTDDEGTRVPGAKVTVMLDEYSGPSVFTDATGRYAIGFDGVPGGIHFPGLDAVGTEEAVTFATVEALGYERFARLILGTTPHLVEDVRLHRIRRITAGESVTLTIAPDDTVCVIDSWPGRGLICGIVYVVIPSTGTLSVEAIPIHPALPRPAVSVYGTNAGSRGNPTAIQVFAGAEYTVNVELPWGGSTNQSVLVKTSITVR